MLALPLALAATLPALVSAHGYIKQITIAGSTQQAQKSNLQQSSFRAAPDNTGWIGSNFLSSECMVCGCSSTPFGTVAAPGGTDFADAAQSAGQTPAIAAGGTMTALVSGNPGQGWPHPNGHLQVYLAKCSSATSCSGFDASQGKFFKIASVPNGVPPLRAAYDGGRDGNPWNVVVPKAVPTGAYIVRWEIIAFGQSSSAEGGQTQFYPFCSQIQVTGGGDATPATVSFPSAYVGDTQVSDPNHVPGPAVDEAFGGTAAAGSGSLDPSSASASVSTTADAGTSNAGAAAPAPAPAPAAAPASGSSSGSSSSGSNTSSGSGHGSSHAGAGTSKSSTTKKGSGKKQCTKKTGAKRALVKRAVVAKRGAASAELALVGRAPRHATLGKRSTSANEHAVHRRHHARANVGAAARLVEERSVFESAEL